MNIKLKNDKPETSALLKAIGSHDFDTSKDAMKIFAKLVGEVAQTVLDETNIIDSFYDNMTVNEFDQKSIHLSDFHDIDDPDYVRVTYSTKPGDLSTSMMVGADDFPIQFFNIQSAISMAKKYLRAGQINHAEAAISKMLNEVIFKMKTQGVQPILQSIAQAQTNSKYHVIRTDVAGKLGLNDFNRLKTLASRIVTSGLGGTPQGTRNFTDLVCSPEVVAEIRAIAYQPMNTRGVPDSAESTAIAAPESLREEVYRSAGIASIYGTNIIELQEMGIGQLYNTFFDEYAGSITYANAGEATDSSNRTAFDGDTEELIIGLNRSTGIKNGLIKAGIADSETSQVFNVRPDTQFMDREDKTGFFGTAEVSYTSVEPRNLFAILM